LVEAGSSILNIFLVLNETFWRFYCDGGWLKFWALLAIVCVWFKAFIWMRLFSRPAFFTNLLLKTILGIVPFTIFLLLLISMLSNVLYVIDKVDNNENYLKNDGTMPKIYSKPFSSDLANTLLHTYLLSLGEFDYEFFGDRDDSTNIMLWLTFAFGTFMLQITFMNMLIAIMGDIFGDVIQRKKQYSLTERIMLLNDFRVYLGFFKLGLDAQFIFLVIPSQDNTIEDTMEEQLALVKESVD